MILLGPEIVAQHGPPGELVELPGVDSKEAFLTRNLELTELSCIYKTLEEFLHVIWLYMQEQKPHPKYSRRETRPASP